MFQKKYVSLWAAFTIVFKALQSEELEWIFLFSQDWRSGVVYNFKKLYV